MTGAVWRPTFIDIEPEFNKFVPTFRNGKLVRDLVPDQPDMALNADYYFPDDHVIAELKCMETDSEIRIRSASPKHSLTSGIQAVI